MARFDTSGIDDIIGEMIRLGEDVGPVAEEICTAAAEEIRDAWKRTAEKHGFRANGDMIDSIGFVNAPTRASDVKAKDIYPIGVDRKGVRNAEKAFLLHYGTSRIKAKYWVDEADDASAEPVEARIQEIWDRFNGN